MQHSINTYDLVEAGKKLGITNPLKLANNTSPLSRLLQLMARKIAQQRLKSLQKIDIKRRQSGDIDS